MGGVLIPAEQWKVAVAHGTPKHEAACDSGVYACMFAKHVLLQRPFTDAIWNVEVLRQQIMWV